MTLTARRLFLIYSCAVIALLLSTSWCANCELPWDIKTLERERITISYPTWLSDEGIERFALIREYALSYAETALGIPFEGRVHYRLRTGIFGYRGVFTAEGVNATVDLTIPFGTDFETDEDIGALAVSLSCHEEVHAVISSYHNWDDGLARSVCSALMEGIAVVVSDAHMNMTTSKVIGQGLLAEGKLLGIRELLCVRNIISEDQDRAQKYVEDLNRYYAGAWLASTLITRHGIAAVLELLELDLCTAPEVLALPSSPAGLIVWEEEGRLIRQSIRSIDDGHEEQGRTFIEMFWRMIEMNWEAKLLPYWVTAPYDLIAPSQKILDLISIVEPALLVIVGHPEFDEVEVLEQGLGPMLDDLEELLERWYGAVYIFEQALELDAGGAAASEIIPLLHIAKHAYADAGDEYMADKAEAWLERLTQQPEEVTAP